MKMEDFKKGQLVYLRAREDFKNAELEENFTEPQIELLGHIVTVEDLTIDKRLDGTPRYVKVKLKECLDSFYAEDFLGRCKIQIGDAFRIIDFDSAPFAIGGAPWAHPKKLDFSKQYVTIVGYEIDYAIREFGFIIKEDGHKLRWHLNEFVLYTRNANPEPKRTDPNMLFRMKKGPLTSNPYKLNMPSWATWKEKKPDSITTGRSFTSSTGSTGGIITGSRPKIADQDNYVIEELEPYIKPAEEEVPGPSPFEWKAEYIEKAKIGKPKRKLPRDKKLENFAKMYTFTDPNKNIEPLPEIKPGEVLKEQVAPALEEENKPVQDSSSYSWLETDLWSDDEDYGTR